MTCFIDSNKLVGIPRPSENRFRIKGGVPLTSTRVVPTAEAPDCTAIARPSSSIQEDLNLPPSPGFRFSSIHVLQTSEYAYPQLSKCAMARISSYAFFRSSFHPLEVSNPTRQRQRYEKLTSSAVWVKRGICSADSLINIALCCLGYLPGLFHAWVIILSPEHPPLPNGVDVPYDTDTD